MVPARDPDSRVVRRDVQKSVKKLRDEAELLFRRLLATRIRLRDLDVRLRERGKNSKDKN